ncbi:hypothetical protein Tco_0080035 [Tanacetum coccineum]
MVHQLTKFHVQRVDMVINPPWNLPFLGAKRLTSPEQPLQLNGSPKLTMDIHLSGGQKLNYFPEIKAKLLLLRDVAASFDSAVHRDHAGSFDAVVPSLVSAACCTAGLFTLAY